MLRSTSDVKDSVIFPTWWAASTPGHGSWTPQFRATNVSGQATAQLEDIPLLIEFAEPTFLILEQNRISALPIIGNGPPGTFVVSPAGLRVSLPTDQIVFADDSLGCVRVGFGGMRFVRSEAGRLVFVRFRELYAEDQLSPARSHTMLLDPQWVTSISVDGSRVWPGHSPFRQKTCRGLVARG
jgi:hypothetical protein